MPTGLHATMIPRSGTNKIQFMFLGCIGQTIYSHRHKYFGIGHCLNSDCAEGACATFPPTEQAMSFLTRMVSVA